MGLEQSRMASLDQDGSMEKMLRMMGPGMKPSLKMQEQKEDLLQGIKKAKATLEEDKDVSKRSTVTHEYQVKDSVVTRNSNLTVSCLNPEHPLHETKASTSYDASLLEMDPQMLISLFKDGDEANKKIAALGLVLREMDLKKADKELEGPLPDMTEADAQWEKANADFNEVLASLYKAEDEEVLTEDEEVATEDEEEQAERRHAATP